MSSSSRDPRRRDHSDRVRRFYDRESGRYESQRYGTADPRVARPYLERLRFILEMFDVRGRQVLDIGCGPGILEPYLLDRSCRVMALDLSARMVEKARLELASHPGRENVAYCVASADSLPFGNAVFDAVACIGVVSYWPELTRGLGEIARVLRPGGTLILQASNRLAPREWEDRLLRKPYHWLRSRITGRDSRDADFPLRTYPPWVVEKHLTVAGLRPLERRHYDFQLPLLATLSPSAAERVAESLLRFSGSRSLGLLATGFLIKAVRDA